MCFFAIHPHRVAKRISQLPHNSFMSCGKKNKWQVCFHTTHLATWKGEHSRSLLLQYCSINCIVKQNGELKKKKKKFNLKVKVGRRRMCSMFWTPLTIRVTKYLQQHSNLRTNYNHANQIASPVQGIGGQITKREELVARFPPRDTIFSKYNWLYYRIFVTFCDAPGFEPSPKTLFVFLKDKDKKANVVCRCGTEPNDEKKTPKTTQNTSVLVCHMVPQKI